MSVLVCMWRCVSVAATETKDTRTDGSGDFPSAPSLSPRSLDFESRRALLPMLPSFASPSPTALAILVKERALPIEQRAYGADHSEVSALE